MGNAERRCFGAAAIAASAEAAAALGAGAALATAAGSLGVSAGARAHPITQTVASARRLTRTPPRWVPAIDVFHSVGERVAARRAAFRRVSSARDRAVRGG